MTDRPITPPRTGRPGVTRPAGRVHYGWVIALLGMATVFAALGIARFSLGMLLPSMRADLTLSYTTMGWISTGNFVGYLVGALTSGSVVARIGSRRTTTLALLTVVAGLVVVALAGGASVIVPAYLVTGVGSGVANVAVMGLVPRWFERSLRGRASGIMVIGSGFALMLSGLMVPILTDRWGARGWRLGWGVLAVVVLAVAVVVALLVRNDPAELGLAPHGHPGRGTPDRAARPAVPVRATMAHLAAVYLLFGATYVVYVTFIVSTLVDRGFSERVAGRFWIVVGLLSIASGPIFGVLSDRAGRRVGLATVFTLHAVAYLLVAVPVTGAAPLYASVALFGISAWSIPGIMGAAVGDYLGPLQAATAFGRLTVAFGAGQAAGPVIAGAMAEHFGSFGPAFALTAALATGAAVLSLMLRPPPAT